VKKIPLTARQRPTGLHQPGKKSAQVKRRSPKRQTLPRLVNQSIAEKVVTGKEAAALLRKSYDLLTREEHHQIADGIEEARRRMADEHLH